MKQSGLSESHSRSCLGRRARNGTVRLPPTPKRGHVVAALPQRWYSALAEAQK